VGGFCGRITLVDLMFIAFLILFALAALFPAQASWTK
jgi:hypothetical protein